MEPKTKKLNQSTRGGKIVLILFILIVTVLIIGGLASNGDKKPASNTSNTISQSDAENYCQDAALLGKYLDLKKVSVISLSNYNARYTDSGNYDKEGTPIKYLTWNGKNKASDKPAGFSCWISGKNKDNITLHWLSFDNVDLYGSPNFDLYDQQGKLQN